jgi:hypothetical protein
MRYHAGRPDYQPEALRFLDLAHLLETSREPGHVPCAQRALLGRPARHPLPRPRGHLRRTRAALQPAGARAGGAGPAARRPRRRRLAEPAGDRRTGVRALQAGPGQGGPELAPGARRTRRRAGECRTRGLPGRGRSTARWWTRPQAACQPCAISSHSLRRPASRPGRTTRRCSQPSPTRTSTSRCAPRNWRCCTTPPAPPASSRRRCRPWATAWRRCAR